MKVKRRQYKSWDEEHEDVRIRLAEARLSLKRTRSSLKEAESERDRMTRLHLIASKRVDDTRAEHMSVQRLLDESKHKREDATHRGLPRYRWDADVRRLESQADRMSDELRRREDESRRSESATKKLDLEIRDLQSDLESRATEVDLLSKRFQRLRQLGRGIRAYRRQRPSGRAATTGTAQEGLQISTRATGALRETLEGMERGPGELLRLIADADGRITLVLDSTRPGDTVISHDNVPVLIVDPTTLPQSLLGKTLDVSLSYEGTQIVVS